MKSVLSQVSLSCRISGRFMTSILIGLVFGVEGKQITLQSLLVLTFPNRKLLKISFEKLASFYPIPALTQQLATLSFDKFNLDNLLDYYEFQMLLHPEMNELNANPNSDFKKAVRTYIKPELKVRFDDFTKNHLLSSESLAENLSEGKIINAPPYIEELMTELTHKRYVDENIPKLSNPELFLNQLCDYVAHDLFYNPIIRKVVYRQYFEKILLSTEPTTKGRKELDIYNISYSVKRIDGRPLKDLEGRK